MPQFITRAERHSIREVVVEAATADEAQAKVRAMTESELERHEGDYEVDYHWTFDWTSHPVDDEPIAEPPAEPMSIRLGGDELLHNLMAGDGHNLPVEACQ